jgi:hypothetical protein
MSVRRRLVSFLVAFVTASCGGRLADAPSAADGGDATLAPEVGADTCVDSSCVDAEGDADLDAFGDVRADADATGSDVQCAPKTCAGAGAACGCLDDGCGRRLDCGDCAPGLSCGGGGVPNVCGGFGCSPKTCTNLGASCGLSGDGCGGILDCGECGGGATCTLNRCAPTDGGCVPRTCAQAHADCGPGVDDGCGGKLDCGACPAGFVCGQLTPNKCFARPMCGASGDAGTTG